MNGSAVETAWNLVTMHLPYIQIDSLKSLGRIQNLNHIFGKHLNYLKAPTQKVWIPLIVNKHIYAMNNLQTAWCIASISSHASLS